MIFDGLAKSLYSILKVAVFSVAIVSIAGCPSGSSGSISAPSYYVDATGGNDANPGTSSSSPWKTLNKVSTSTFLSGTTINLKRGDTWYEQLDIPSSGVSIDAYGSGALPVIDGSSEIGNSGWATLGGNIYSIRFTPASGEGLGNVSENGTLLNFVAWDNNSCASTLASSPTGTYAYGYPATICIKVATNPNTIANASAYPYRASKKFFGINALSKSNISIKNVQIQRFSLNGVNYKNCTACIVSSVVVKQGGGATIASGLYAGNGVECDNSCTNILIDNVTVSDIFDSGISPQTYISGQTASNITIRNSSVNNAGFAGVEISALSNVGSTGSTISNITVSNLTITNSGKGWSGRRYGTEGHGIRIVADNFAGVDAGSMTNILVQDTLISASAGDGIKLGGNIGVVTINRAKIKSNNIGINVADASATRNSLKLLLTTSLIYGNSGYGVSFNAPNSKGFALYHNTFYDNATINFAVGNFDANNLLWQSNLQNNLFDSSAAMTHFYMSSKLTLEGNVVVNNNCYREWTNMFGIGFTTAYSTVAAFTTATGFEVDGYGGSQAQVALTNPAAEIFTLLSTSQCKSMGASGLGVTLDYDLHNYDITHPSSGAYQF